MKYKPTKINNIVKISLATVLLLTLGLSQTKNQNVLDLFDGVVKADASTGNVNPLTLCATSTSYYQFESTSTLNDIIINTQLNTELILNDSIITSNLSPALTSSQTIGNNQRKTACIQNLPIYGDIYQNLQLFPITSTSPERFQLDFANAKYKPKNGFKGVECFSIFTSYTDSSLLPFYGYSITGTLPGSFRDNDTNIAQVKIQVGGSTSTTCGPDPVVGQVGSPFPSLWVNTAQTIPNARLTFGSAVINGSVLNNIFTPTAGQTIPASALTNPSGIILDNDSTAILVPTSFSPAPSTGGATITINTAQSSVISSSSLPSSSVVNLSNTSSSQVPLPLANSTTTPIKPLELFFRKYGVKSASNLADSTGNKLDITDPYICEQQIVTGNVKYTGDFKDLNPVSLKFKNYNSNSKSYSSKPTVNSNGDYEVDVKSVEEGNYQVEYSISDKLGNSANGTYSFEKKDVCDQNSLNSKGSSIINPKATAMDPKTLNLTRTGGLESSFIFALISLLFAMTVISSLSFGKGE